MSVLPWVEVAFSMSDPLDFDRFKHLCQEQGVKEAFVELDYKNRVRNIQQIMAERNEGPQTAYAYWIEEQQAFHGNTSFKAPRDENGKPVIRSCCGGGRIR